VIAQDIRENQDCQVAPFSGDLLYTFDQADGHALLDNIDAQQWGTNHHIAMYGLSNGGIVAYLAAIDASPSLRGIQTHYATGDLLNYGLFNGGVWHKDISTWPVDLPTNMPWVDYVHMVDNVGMPFWDKYLINSSQAAKVNVPGLHVGGWFDAFGQGLIDSFWRLQTAGGLNAKTRQKLVMGPWEHTDGNVVGDQRFVSFPSSSQTAAGLAPNGQYDLAWKQCVFHDNCSDWDHNLPAVKVYLMNASAGNEWKTYGSWPPPATYISFFFTSNLQLSGVQPAAGQVSPFTANPSNPCPTFGGNNNLVTCAQGGACGSWDQRTRIETRSDVRVFTSDELPNGGTIVGRISANVWIKTPLADVDVFVRMTDVYPDGGPSMLVAQGIRRARYRNGTTPQPLQNTATMIPVDLSSTAIVIKPRHKLRVIVSASADPLYSLNPQNNDEYPGAHPNVSGPINILVGSGQASALIVPQPL
jgi:putative CocE/NonD family hydrolase